MAHACRIVAFVQLVMLAYFGNTEAENILLTPLFGSSHYLLFRHIAEELGNRGHKVNIASRISSHSIAWLEGIFFLIFDLTAAVLFHVLTSIFSCLHVFLPFDFLECIRTNTMTRNQFK